MEGSKLKLCPHCGAKMMEYKHTLNRGLVNALVRLAESGGGPLNVNTLNLTHNQLANWQKLRYWDLVTQDPEDHNRGVWRITDRGWAFLRGSQAIPKTVVTYRGERLRYEGPIAVTLNSDLEIEYKQRPEYAEDSEPHEEAA